MKEIKIDITVPSFVQKLQGHSDPQRRSLSCSYFSVDLQFGPSFKDFGLNV